MAHSRVNLYLGSQAPRSLSYDNAREWFPRVSQFYELGHPEGSGIPLSDAKCESGFDVLSLGWLTPSPGSASFMVLRNPRSRGFVRPDMDS